MPSSPGVYVSEAPLPRSITSPAPTQTVGAFLGTALYGPTTPTFVESWTDFVSKFGGFGRSMTLPMALNQFFLNSGTGAYVCRVVDSSASKASATYTDGGSPAVDLLVFTASTPGSWGNSVSVSVVDVDTVNATFSIEVAQAVSATYSVAREKFVRLSLNPTSARYVESVVNSTTIGSAIISVQVTSTADFGKFTPSASPLILVGGTDVAPAQPTGSKAAKETAATGIDYKSAFRKFDDIEASLVINIPRGPADLFTASSDGTSILEQVESRGDSVLIVDPPENTSVETLVSGTGIPSGSTYAAVYYPWIYVPDPDGNAPRGSIVKVPPGASVVGMILRVDKSPTGGVAKAPAGVVAGIASVATEKRLSNSELDLLAANNINPIRPIPGTGITVMGARVRGNQNQVQFLSVRRTLNYIKKQAVLSSRFAVFEPNSPLLWDQLRVVNGAFLNEMWRNGMLVGSKASDAFYVKCDAAINTPQSVANGEVNIEIGVAPVYPAEFIIIRVAHFDSGAASIANEEV